jgi:hypothetical protein
MKKVIVKINPELHEVQFDYTLTKNEVEINGIRKNIDIQSSYILDNTDELEEALDVDEILFDTMKIKKV